MAVMDEKALAELRQTARIAAGLDRSQAAREWLVGNIGGYMQLIAQAERLEAASQTSPSSFPEVLRCD